MDRITLSQFSQKLTDLLNEHSAENGSNTPDWILRDFLLDCLSALDRAIKARDSFYGRELEPGCISEDDGLEIMVEVSGSRYGMKLRQL
jgi:hypothetical protein